MLITALAVLVAVSVGAVLPVGAQSGLSVALSPSASFYENGQPIGFTVVVTIDGEAAAGAQICVEATGINNYVWGACYIADSTGRVTGSISGSSITTTGQINLRADATYGDSTGSGTGFVQYYGPESDDDDDEPPDSEILEIYLQSDRSTYDPGSTANLTGRVTYNGFGVASIDVGITVYDWPGLLQDQMTVVTASDGSFSARVTIGADAARQVQFIATASYSGESARTDLWRDLGTTDDPPDVPDDDDVEVVVTLEADELAYNPGDSMRLTGSVFVNGGLADNVSLTLRIFDVAGTLLVESDQTTDLDGNYEVSITVGVVEGAQVRVEVTATAAGVQGSAAIWVDIGDDPVGELVVFVQPPERAGWTGYRIAVGDRVAIGGRVTLDGAAVPNGYQVVVEVGGAVFTVPTIDDGVFLHANVSTDHLSPGRHQVTVTVTSPEGATGTGTATLVIDPSPNELRLRIEPGGPYTLGDTVRVTGRLTFGGAGVEDWFELDHEAPGGAVTTWLVKTEADGTFSIDLRAGVVGVHALTAHRYPHRELIGSTVTFSVGGAEVPPPGVGDDDDEPDGTGTPRIVEVEFDNPVAVGDQVTITGRVIDDEDGPFANTRIELEVDKPRDPGDVFYLRSGELTVVTSGPDGRFTVSFVAKRLGLIAFSLRTDDPFSPREFDGDVFGDRVEARTTLVVSGVGPWSHDVRVDGRRAVTGDPAIVVQLGDLGELTELGEQRQLAALSVTTQVVGPDGRMYESSIAPRGDRTRSDVVLVYDLPVDAPSGAYEVIVTAFHPHADPVTVEGVWTITNALAGALDAYVETKNPDDPYDTWFVPRIDGEFRNASGSPVDGATVSFTAVAADGRRFESAAVFTDASGQFVLPLDDLYFLDAGKGSRWEIVVKARKQGAVGADATITHMTSLGVRVEIVAFDPPLDRLSDLGLTLDDLGQRIPLMSTVTVRYRLLSDGALDIGTAGAWAVDFVTRSVNNVLVCERAQPDVTINGVSAVEVSFTELFESNPYGDVVPQGDGAERWGYGSRRYPSVAARIPVEATLDGSIDVIVQGQLFDWNTPAAPERKPCSYSADRRSPEVGTQASRATVEVVAVVDTAPPADDPTMHPSLEAGRTQGTFAVDGIAYQASFKLGRVRASGTATVGRAGGSFDAVVRRVTGNGVLPDTAVTLQVLESRGGDYSTTGFARIVGTARTDARGRVKVPMELGSGSDPCDPPGLIWVELLVPGYAEGARIPVRLDCVPDIDVQLRDVTITQAAELTSRPALIAAGLDTLVRAEIALDGDIYARSSHLVVRMVVKVGAVAIIEQVKFVALSERGASVAWDGRSPSGGLSGTVSTGRAKTWDGTAGEQATATLPVDFVFRPSDVDGLPVVIEVTADVDGRFGEPQSKQIEATVKRMKRIDLLFIPVDLFDIDKGFIESQVALIRNTYPAAAVTWRIGNRLSTTVDIGATYDVLPGDPLGVAKLRVLAWALAGRHPSSETGAVITRVVGVVAKPTWYRAYGEAPTSNATLPSGVRYGDVLMILNETQETHVLAHELGHNLGLYTWLEQKTLNPPDGIEVKGTVLKGGAALEIPDDYADPSDSAVKGWRDAFSRSGTAKVDQKASFANIIDFMGSPVPPTSQTWVASETYEKLLRRLADPLDQPVLLVTGSVEGDLLVWPGFGVPEDDVEGGSVEVRTVTGSGVVVDSVVVEPLSDPGVESPLFSAIVPLGTGVAALEVITDGRTIARLDREAAIATPTARGVVAADGAVVLEWQLSDAGPGLRALIQIEADGAWVPFHAVAGDVTTMTIDSEALPGGASSFRVALTDGFTLVPSAPIEIVGPDRPPLVTMNAPWIGEGGILELTGDGSDREDGVLAGGSLRWLSSVDGLIGEGGRVFADLSVGEHTVMLVAVDSAGNAARTAITVTVAGAVGSRWGEAPWWALGSAGVMALVLAVASLVAVPIRRRRATAEAPPPLPPPPPPPVFGPQSGGVVVWVLAGVLAVSGAAAAGWFLAPASSIDEEPNVTIESAALDETVHLAHATAPTVMNPEPASLDGTDIRPDDSPSQVEAFNAVSIERVDTPEMSGPGAQQVLGIAPTRFGMGAVGSTEREGVATVGVWLTVDGEIWQELPTQPSFERGTMSQLVAVTGLADGDFVAMGRQFDGVAWTVVPFFSVGGDRWRRSPLAEPLAGGSQMVFDLIGLDDGFVAVGYVVSDTDLDAAWWWSPDGRAWSASVLREPGDQVMTGAVIGPDGRIVVVGAHQRIADGALTDGSSASAAVWISEPGTPAMRRVLDPGLETDGLGIAWDVAAQEDGLIAVGRVVATGASTATPSAWLSADGVAWQHVDVASPENSHDVFDRVLPVAGGWIVVGRTGVGDIDITLWGLDRSGIAIELGRVAEPGTQLPYALVESGGRMFVGGVSGFEGRVDAAVWVIE